MLLKEVIGHDEVKKRFVNAVKEGRVSHALLISGMEGSGGLPLALAFAQYLTCERVSAPKTEMPLFDDAAPADEFPDDSCGTCSSCIKNRKMVHPDVHYSFPAVKDKDKEAKSVVFMEEFRACALQNPYMDSNDWMSYLGVENKQGFISVEESADILRRLQLKSFESIYKILILWLPEKLRTDSANKLLKILEEPPERTVFFLVTENRDQLLPTILSRTQLIKAARINDADIISGLMKEKAMSEADARYIARLADGNYHAALNLASSELPEKSAEELFIEWMRLCFQPMKALPKLYKWVDEMSKSGREAQKQFLLSSIHIIRECLMVNVGEEQLVKLDERQYEQLKLFMPFVQDHNVHAMIKDLNDAVYHIERNANPRILFLDLSFRLSSMLKKA
jgi:DNA polymerase-3 subunit delta'